MPAQIEVTETWSVGLDDDRFSGPRRVVIEPGSNFLQSEQRSIYQLKWPNVLAPRKKLCQIRSL